MIHKEPEQNYSRPTAPIVIQASPQAEITPNQKRREKFKDLGKILFKVVATFVIAWTVFTYVIGTTEVNGVSMQPTLHTGNILIVWKLPLTWARIIHNIYIPKRGDVVIVQDTNNSGLQFVKRVIALPDEQVNIANGIVTVYNLQYPQGFNPDAAPFGKDLIPTQGAFSGQVGDGQIFVMGDNRATAASIDSRSSLGNIPYNYIVGQVVIRVWPFDQIKLF